MSSPFPNNIVPHREIIVPPGVPDKPLAPGRRVQRYDKQETANFINSVRFVAAGNPLWNDAAWHYKLNETSGSRVDSTANGLDLSVQGSVGSQTGKIGNASDHTEGGGGMAANHLYRADNTGHSMGDIDFEICFWLKMIAFAGVGSTTPLVGKWQSGDLEYAVRLPGGYPASIRFQFSVRNTANSATATLTASTFGLPSTNVWYFLNVWHDSVNNLLGIRVNNGSEDTLAHSGGVRDGTANFTLGYQDSATGGEVYLDSVSGFKRLLTSTERTAMYNSGNGLDYGG